MATEGVITWSLGEREEGRGRGRRRKRGRESERERERGHLATMRKGKVIVNSLTGNSLTVTTRIPRTLPRIE